MFWIVNKMAIIKIYVKNITFVIIKYNYRTQPLTITARLEKPLIKSYLLEVDRHAQLQSTSFSLRICCWCHKQKLFPCLLRLKKPNCSTFFNTVNIVKWVIGFFKKVKKLFRVNTCSKIFWKLWPFGDGFTNNIFKCWVF